MIRLVFVVLLAAGFTFPADAARNVALASEGAVAAADPTSLAVMALKPPIRRDRRG
jgi:hypothetical protein